MMELFGQALISHNGCHVAMTCVAMSWSVPNSIHVFLLVDIIIHVQMYMYVQYVCALNVL